MEPWYKGLLWVFISLLIAGGAWSVMSMIGLLWRPRPKAFARPVGMEVPATLAAPTVPQPRLGRGCLFSGMLVFLAMTNSILLSHHSSSYSGSDYDSMWIEVECNLRTIKCAMETYRARWGTYDAVARDTGFQPQPWADLVEGLGLTNIHPDMTEYRIQKVSPNSFTCAAFKRDGQELVPYLGYSSVTNTFTRLDDPPWYPAFSTDDLYVLTCIAVTLVTLVWTVRTDARRRRRRRAAYDELDLAPQPLANGE